MLNFVVKIEKNDEIKNLLQNVLKHVIMFLVVIHRITLTQQMTQGKGAKMK